MENRELIISLILQDLRHYQLTAALTKAGLDADLHDLEIMEVVAQLMGIESGQLTDQWADLYFNYVYRAPEYEVSERGKTLRPLATECYDVLVACTRVLKI